MFQGLVGDVPVVVDTHFLPNFKFFAAFLHFFLNFCLFLNSQKARKLSSTTFFIIITSKRRFFRQNKKIFWALRRVSVAIITFSQKFSKNWPKFALHLLKIIIKFTTP